MRFLVYIDFGTMALLLASAVISMVISTRRKKVDFAMRDAHAPVIRRGQYINKIFMLPDYAKELRLSQISECINREYEIFIKDHILITVISVIDCNFAKSAASDNSTHRRISQHRRNSRRCICNE